jgi:molybdate transport system substrate-binding protein
MPEIWQSPEIFRFDPGSFDNGRFSVMRTGLAVSLLLFGMLFSTRPAGASDAPLIAAASSMQFALREIAQSYKQDTGVELRLTLGASGKLFRQIENNAPFELFISADDRLAQKLAASPRARLPRVILARGRLAVFAAHGSPLRPDARLDGLADALAEGQISKFAIANPAHAPYGLRAREALQSAGLWSRLQDKLVVGENVAQAAQFAISGAAQGGIVAHSLLVTDKTSDRGRYALLPESWHRPILHSMVLLENSDDTTMAFFRYLRSPRAQQILSRFGYAPAL